MNPTLYEILVALGTVVSALAVSALAWVAISERKKERESRPSDDDPISERKKEKTVDFLSTFSYFTEFSSLNRLWALKGYLPSFRY